MKLLAKTAFICNILFLVCVLVQHTYDFIGQQDLKSTIIILGWIIAPFLNLIFFISFSILWAIGKKQILPPWLLISNLLILIAQVYIYFIAPL
jgi:hypothetical protein